ncbi:MAG: dihydroorotate dehydrogenase electron transfer subunit [Candidatus Cloacimonadota bacterium]|nr:dihydroorotate dehydrogenase electron transfer subunit [Candidatus Cloacimonadota bacterium]
MFYKSLRIVEKLIINSRYFMISVVHDEIAKSAKPGQFCEIKNPDHKFPILPRPFSIHNIEGNKISFLIKKVGKSTEQLSKISVGEKISVLGPLGNGFDLQDEKKVIVVSGGIGYAPMKFLRQKLRLKRNQVFSLHGGGDEFDVFSEDAINFTEDGSLGKKGLVTDGLNPILDEKEIDIVYACGPNIMMREIVKICRNYNLQIQVSLETVMACGVGVCCGCVVKTREEGQIVFKKVCKDGPVFDGRKVDWDE